MIRFEKLPRREKKAFIRGIGREAYHHVRRGGTVRFGHLKMEPHVMFVLARGCGKTSALEPRWILE